MVSADNFSIVPGDAQVQVNERGAELQDNDLGRSRDKGKEGKRNPGPSGREANASSARAGANARMTDIKTSANSTAGSKSATKTFSASPAGGTYYIYSFDGRLLAEYNLYGTCVRDYIYFGGQLVAEYDTVGQQIYYYTSDQIGSTRIVTNSAGVVVYAAAHDPYGGIQQTWVNAFNPTPKFSGKERDGESDLDYFGARYYDHSLYRFLSVDPKIPGSVSLFNQQRWNLYAYCLGNPANYVDPAGGNPQSFTITIARYLTEGNACYGQLIVNGERIGFTLENDMSKIAVNVYKGTLVRVSDGSWQIKLSYYRPAGVNSNNQLVLYQAAIMEGWDVNKSHGCIFIGKSWLSPGSIIPDGVMTELNNLVKDYIKAMSKQAAAVSAAMTGGNYLSQIGMVLSALDVLSSLGNIQSLWDSMQFELTVTIIDIQKGADQ